MTFDHQLSFYNILDDLSKEASVIIVSDLEDPGLPLPNS
jgi:hypothetical protein